MSRQKWVCDMQGGPCTVPGGQRGVFPQIHSALSIQSHNRVMEAENNSGDRELARSQRDLVRIPLCHPLSVPSLTQARELSGPRCPLCEIQRASVSRGCRGCFR